jgi:hypothetical protein
MHTTVLRFSIPHKEANKTVIKFIGSLLERGNINTRQLSIFCQSATSKSFFCLTQWLREQKQTLTKLLKNKQKHNFLPEKITILN